ncbi:protein phosphatase 2C domain-containing protein [Nocardiopsis ansamitocini]|uniref:PPM-type phosphatase domain-containing protein n=1 Tax=Nocardiopsis ansamitocini TaxID=1670832 RepID=A0A9W6UKZ3_9ACTN|nr:protein phosphatase 2C domain-containing protein [Nocardiopsis ansamitocini]GLU50133.1 hypothetical protein Nans01_44840 [Nocardiopsis ansamitocini]
MPYRLATDPGRTDRDNEDFAAVSTNAAVLLDGAGAPEHIDSGCVHGVAWYTRTLGALLLATTRSDGKLADALAEAITATASLHSHTCDLDNPDTPSATVVLVRLTGEHLDYLVLSDSVLLLDVRGADPVAITDDRLGQVSRELRRHTPPSAGHEQGQERRDYETGLSKRRNASGGFWVAAATPHSAYEAITGSVPLADLDGFALLSDGASRLTDRFGLATWRATLDLLAAEGPRALIDQVRHAENSDNDGERWPRSKHHDDATAAVWRPGN